MVTKSLTFLYEEQELQLRHILSFIYHLIALNNNTDYPFTLNNNIVHFLNFYRLYRLYLQIFIKTFIVKYL